MYQVIFSHGKESGPWGSKIKRLAATAQALGCSVESIDYTDTMDPDVRASRLQQCLAGRNLQKVILVGSSMGGYVTLQASKTVSVLGVFVLAPAIFMPGYEDTAPSERIDNLSIVHGWGDEVIPVEHSIRFASAQRCTLHLVDDDHRLMVSLDHIDKWFGEFLKSLLPA